MQANTSTERQLILMDHTCDCGSIKTAASEGTHDVIKGLHAYAAAHAGGHQHRAPAHPHRSQP
eukprot:scaffold292585_cov23-Tisochrysis_lutea.AAC.1